MLSHIIRASLILTLGLTVLCLMSTSLSGVPVPREKPWGDLTGRFIFKGKHEPEAIPAVLKRNGFQNLPLVDESLVVGREGGIANIAVYLSKRPKVIHPSYKKKKVNERPLIVKDGQFQPRIVPIQEGQSLLMENQTTVATNIFGQLQKNTPFNILIHPGKQWRKDIMALEKQPVPITSTIHQWMRAYLITTDHPYIAVTGTDGSFVLHNLPVGEWEFRAWHEKLGYIALPGGTRNSTKVKIHSGVNCLETLTLPASHFEKAQ